MIPGRSITVPVGPDAAIVGDLLVPAGAGGLVVFARGSGSSRHSQRNRSVADVLQRAAFATLLLDLLTIDEESADRRDGRIRFDIPPLAARLQAAGRWAAQDRQTAELPVGYFGASTGAAAALVAAARQPDRVAAVVSRGGRPDLADADLPRVKAATLLIVGSLDHRVIELNRLAYDRLPVERRLELVPGATHLFEEPGTLPAAAELARRWFQRHLDPHRGREGDPP